MGAIGKLIGGILGKIPKVPEGQISEPQMAIVGGDVHKKLNFVDCEEILVIIETISRSRVLKF
jgi:hypothetical protein